MLALAALLAALPAQRPDAEPMLTEWGRALDPDNPLPEHPRPQMRRERWTNLNGRWDYALRPRGADRPAAWDGEIVVPFCIESALSGVGRRVSPEEELWYRTTLTADCDAGERLLLHFGAVDWECTVWLGERRLGTHRGGYDPFTFELPELEPASEHELVVRVWDPTDAGPQPVGKQRRDNRGIWYTPVTGIWQTVWLEPVSRRGHLAAVRPRTAGGTALLAYEVVLPGDGKYFLEGNDLAADRGFGVGLDAASPAPEALRLEGWSFTPWSPEYPVVHAFELRLLHDGEVIDRVEVPYAHRDVTVQTAPDGKRRIFLNGEPRFLLGTLDQGWWPDGLYTAPSDEALVHDLEVTKRLGFDTVRKHVKVEPARWSWHCDRLGLIVWQDLPNPARAARWYPWREPGEGAELPEEAPEGPAFRREMREIVARHPWGSTVVWTLYNEAWGQWRTRALTEELRTLAPACLIDSASGGNDFGTGDLNDVHAYPGPAMPPPEEERAVVLGEFGGLGLPVRGHLWTEDDHWGYRSFDDAAALTDRYVELLRELRLLQGEGLAGAIYTQTTDVETEVNGLMTYDRAVVKMDEERVRAANRALRRPAPAVETVLADARTEPRAWRFVTEEPAGDWTAPGYDDSGWQVGTSGFGTEGTPGAVVGTTWDTDAIWLRTEFDFGVEAAPQGATVVLDDAFLRLHHDEDAEVWLNGELLCEREGYVTGYRLIPLPPTELRSGRNVLAIRCRQTTGGQFIDAGLVRLRPRPADPASPR